MTFQFLVQMRAVFLGLVTVCISLDCTCNGKLLSGAMDA